MSPRLEAAGRTAGKLLVYLLLAAFGILMVMPFYWMIVTSFQIPENLIAFPPKWLPQPPTLEHYQDAVEKAPFLLYYRNSFIVAAISVSWSRA